MFRIKSYALFCSRNHTRYCKETDSETAQRLTHTIEKQLILRQKINFNIYIYNKKVFSKII